ncbi:MAG: 2,3-bisphosphoglycerate-independent phosphoglycerate mutase [Thermodesulfovibrionales bacterium]|nr:2,3-bisphosphoglycerate-independent phosphoglycerate mutase [Thermodesulfovibrionales bacterium]
MQSVIKSLLQKNKSKIILVVLDGVGGLPINGKTELEQAKKPNLDKLAQVSACGLHIPVSYGITPGSGPGHLGLFGYNPLECQIGRGVLEALGLGIELKKTDVAIRCNYATLKDNIITDRRAGRIQTEESKKLTEKLQQEISFIDNVEIIFAQGMEHRFVTIFRFKELLTPDSALISDTDPQKEGLPPLLPRPLSENAIKVSAIAEKLLAKSKEVLKHNSKANFILLRGFSTTPDIPTFYEAFGLKALAIAAYPMYRGLARLIEMDAPIFTGTVEDEINFLIERYNDYDFFFLHVKKIDSYGEDGNFEGKASEIEAFDKVLPKILELNPDVLIITGDHSTPALLKSHSWHPVPVLLKSPFVLGRTSNAFTERECLKGELGIFQSMHLLPLALANSMRLKKYGA